MNTVLKNNNKRLYLYILILLAISQTIGLLYAVEMDIPTIGGSDAHSYRQLNTIVTKFNVPINSMDDIVKAIRNKECKAIKI